MDPAQALSLKVDSYLKETRDLINQQHVGGGGDANNSTATAGIIDSAIRSDIYRRFSLLHSIFTSDNHSITPELTRVKNRILDAEREMRATKEDIKAARIVMPSRKPLDPFHFYLQLHGPVVRVQILSYLTDPQDQLNMIDAVPSEEQLMNWNREKIKLELVFQILMKRGPYPWRMIYNFSRASQVHQSIVERIASKGLLRPTGIHYSNMMGVLQARQDVDSDNFLPVDVLFVVRLDGNDDSLLQINEQISLLRRIGHRIWFCSIWLPKIPSSSLQILQVLSNLLSLMPNLKELVLFTDSGASSFIDFDTGTLTVEQIDREKTSIQNFQLPDCPSLRRLFLHGSSVLSLTIAPILAKYAVGLRNLHVGDGNNIEDTNIVQIHSPNLSVLSVLSQTEVLDIPQCLRMLPNAPLKYLMMSVRRGNTGVNFSNILSYISRQYGDTLEELQLRNLSCPDLAPSLLESTWMLEASFPKVKRLRLLYEYWQQVYGLTFVLLFPALEELYIYNATYNETTEENFFGTDQNYLELSLTRQDMLKSVIWKLFPKLRFVKFARRANELRIEIRITRKDCIEAQQNAE